MKFRLKREGIQRQCCLEVAGGRDIFRREIILYKHGKIIIDHFLKV